jgi:hypothetical protein
LGDWATEGDALLESILKRPCIQGISEQDFRTVATKPGVVLLLDGWNELDAAARERARVQITALKTELPELGLVISTRRQALDIPFGGTRVDLLPLDDEQQMEIRARHSRRGRRTARRSGLADSGRARTRHHPSLSHGTAVTAGGRPFSDHKGRSATLLISAEN